MAAPRIVCHDAQHCVAYWNNVAIVDVCGDLDLARMRAIGEAYAALLQRYPEGIIAIVITQPNTPIAGDEARAEGSRMLKALGDGLLQVFVVVEARGMLANLMRSIMRGVNVIVRNSRMSVVDSVDDAVRAGAKYVAPAAPRTVIEQQLTAAISSVRNMFASSHQGPRCAGSHPTQ